VIKIRLQLQSHTPFDPTSSHPPRSSPHPLYKGPLSALTTIIRREGVTGLWKGNVPAEALYLTYGSIQFLAYRTTSDALTSLPLPNETHLPAAAVSFLSGAAAGTVATTATYPLDLLRTRFAAQGTDKIYASLAASVRDIAQREGARGFFRGLSAGVGQIVPYMGLFFALYESFKPLCAGVKLPLDALGSGEAVAGVMASILAKTAVFPLDTVRKRLQVQGPTRALYLGFNIPSYEAGVLGTLKAILAREGARGLYRGLSVGLIKAAPASAVTVWTYERTMGMLQRYEEEP